MNDQGSSEGPSGSNDSTQQCGGPSGRVRGKRRSLNAQGWLSAGWTGPAARAQAIGILSGEVSGVDLSSFLVEGQDLGREGLKAPSPQDLKVQKNLSDEQVVMTYGGDEVSTSPTLKKPSFCGASISIESGISAARYCGSRPTICSEFLSKFVEFGMRAVRR